MKELLNIILGKKKEEKFDYPKIQQPLREFKQEEFNEWCREFKVSSVIDKRSRFFSF
jgi:hypothetical protein